MRQRRLWGRTVTAFQAAPTPGAVEDSQMAADVTSRNNLHPDLNVLLSQPERGHGGD